MIRKLFSNLLKACLLKLYYQTDTVDVLNSIACTFTDAMLNNTDNALNACVNQNIEGNDEVDPWSSIHACVIEGTGDSLLQEYSQLVSGLSPNITHVPWILIDDEHDLQAEIRLIDELCSAYYPTDKPPLCQPTLLPVALYYESTFNILTKLATLPLYHMVQHQLTHKATVWKVIHSVWATSIM